jgi:peptide chain release factor subunit 1
MAVYPLQGYTGHWAVFGGSGRTPFEPLLANFLWLALLPDRLGYKAEKDASGEGGQGMQVTSPDRDRLRRLAELRLDRPLVLSFYLDLDPTEFATPPARSTAVRSLLDDADRKLRELDGLSHEDKTALKASYDRAAAFLQRELNTEGAHAIAVFASEPADLFETLKLPRSIRSRVAIGHSPLIGPLVRLARGERWCVALVSRRDARIFQGSPDGLREIEQIHDVVFGQHDQGGWSQARFQRGIEKEKDDHLKNTAEALMRHFKRRPFQRLVTGGPREVVADFESKLHGYLRDRLAGRIEVDVDTARPEQVLEAARPRFEELEHEREAEALERLGERGARGLEQVLRALNERRVETLLLDEQVSAAGVQCPACGWLGPEGESRCPIDGSALLVLENVGEPAIELALQQSAEVLAVRFDREALAGDGGVAALLRF